MTVAAVEAVPEAAGAARAAPAISPARPRRPRGGRQAAAAATPLPPQDRPRPRPRDRGRSTGRQLRGMAPTSRTPRGNYQGIILAEFVAAVLLVALSPFASKKNPDGLSPYVGQDVVKLVAIVLVYFILALVSAGSSGAGRFAAWFGGLILLTVGLAEAAHLAQVIDLPGLTDLKKG